MRHYIFFQVVYFPFKLVDVILALVMDHGLEIAVSEVNVAKLHSIQVAKML